MAVNGEAVLHVSAGLGLVGLRLVHGHAVAPADGDTQMHQHVFKNFRSMFFLVPDLIR